MQQDSFFPQTRPSRRIRPSGSEIAGVRQPPESHYSPCRKKRKKQEPQHLVMMTIERQQEIREAKLPRVMNVHAPSSASAGVLKRFGQKGCSSQQLKSA
jgi:hypothetical protein